MTKYIPNTITLLNLLSGCLAVVAAFHYGQTILGLEAATWVYILIASAAVFDFCDGFAARALKAYSNIGAELDSLSDLVSFGVAPAMLMLNIMLANDAGPWAFAAMLIPMMGALRLAIFNVDTTQTTTFRGLPIPANAIFWIGASAWISAHIYPPTAALVVIILAVSLCMVAPMRMFSLKFKNLNFRENVLRYAIIVACAAFLIFYGVEGLMWTILLYILLSAFSKKRSDDELSAE